MSRSNKKSKSKKGKTKGKTRKKSRKPTASHYRLPLDIERKMIRQGNLLSWSPASYYFARTYVGFAATPQAKSGKGRRQEYEEARKQGRQPHILENARKLAVREEKGKSKPATSRVGVVAGWKTRAPVAGKEREAMAFQFPAAFLVFEEKQSKTTGQIYHIPKFPIVSRSALRTKKWVPDKGGVHAALRRAVQYKDKYSKVGLEKLIEGVLKKQSET